MNREIIFEELPTSKVTILPHVSWEKDHSRQFETIRDSGPYRFLVTVMCPSASTHEEAVNLMSTLVTELDCSICMSSDRINDRPIIGAAVLDDLRMEYGHIIGYIGLKDYPELSRGIWEAVEEIVDYIEAIGYGSKNGNVKSHQQLKLSTVYCYDDPGVYDATDILQRAAWGDPWEGFHCNESQVFEVSSKGLKL